MKHMIEAQIDRIEARLFEILEDDGIRPEDAIHNMDAELEARQKNESFQGSSLRVGYLACFTGIRLSRYLTDCLPPHRVAEVVELLSATSECVGTMAGLNAMTHKPEAIQAAVSRIEIAARKASAARAAKVRHAPTSAAKDAIRAAWASGKYSSRMICAEQEAAAMDISVDTARKALRNTPDPA